MKEKHPKGNVTITINGGICQIMPNVKEVVQYIHTKDGKTTVINRFTTDKKKDKREKKE